MQEPELDVLDLGEASSEAILLALRRIIRRVSLHSKQLARSAGLTLPQVVCLKILNARGDENPATVAEIGHEARLSSATVTGIVDRLERYGYVQRARCTIDRRRVYVRLTDSGSHKVAGLPLPLQESFVRRFEALPASERDAILASLERVVSLMEQDDLVPSLELDVDPLLPTPAGDLPAGDL